MKSPLMTVKEAAEYLKLCPDTVYIMVRAQTFPAVKIGNSWRILKNELDEWLSQQLKDKI